MLRAAKAGLGMVMAGLLTSSLPGTAHTLSSFLESPTSLSMLE